MSFSTKVIFATFLIILMSIWAAIASAPSADFQLSILDVGQGDSILIKSPENQYILVDGGPDNKVVEQLGQKLPFYNHNLDAIILTHPHADHLFGLIEVVKRYQVKKIYLTGVSHTTNEYLEFLNLIKDKNIPTSRIQAGQTSNFGSVELTFLWPKDDLTGKTMDNLNESSAVVNVKYNNFSALLLGDLEKDGQAEMLKNSLLQKINVIKIAHHGSSDGLNTDLLDLVKPEMAVISVGEGNSYGHPAPSTISELEKRNIKIKRTDQDGTVDIYSDGQKFW